MTMTSGRMSLDGFFAAAFYNVTDVRLQLVY